MGLGCNPIGAGGSGWLNNKCPWAGLRKLSRGAYNYPHPLHDEVPQTCTQTTSWCRRVKAWAVASVDIPGQLHAALHTGGGVLDHEAVTRHHLDDLCCTVWQQAAAGHPYQDLIESLLPLLIIITKTSLIEHETIGYWFNSPLPHCHVMPPPLLLCFTLPVQVSLSLRWLQTWPRLIDLLTPSTD